MPSAEPGLSLYPVTGLAEVRPGDDLAELLAAVLIPGPAPGAGARDADGAGDAEGAGDAGDAGGADDGTPVPGGLQEDDVLVVTQKVVSKAEGRLVALDPDDPEAKRALVERESVRIVRRRGDLLITETTHGFICANAGVDLSNVDAGTAALLPVDPDRSARRIREALSHRYGVTVAVIVSDTFGRTWRRGVTDVAIGIAGIAGVVDLRGTPDANGRVLDATEVCVADEVAGAAELVMGKDRGIPAAVVRGVDRRWLRGGSVAEEIVRPPDEDLFR
jgi:coenzyme F420-0:L-glutamate ligase/coenzyme F420-1:gamma-L-glutamate ligase